MVLNGVDPERAAVTFSLFYTQEGRRISAGSRTVYIGHLSNYAAFVNLEQREDLKGLKGAFFTLHANADITGILPSETLVYAFNTGQANFIIVKDETFKRVVIVDRCRTL